MFMPTTLFICVEYPSHSGRRSHLIPQHDRFSQHAHIKRLEEDVFIDIGQSRSTCRANTYPCLFSKMMSGSPFFECMQRVRKQRESLAASAEARWEIVDTTASSDLPTGVSSQPIPDADRKNEDISQPCLSLTAGIEKKIIQHVWTIE